MTTRGDGQGGRLWGGGGGIEQQWSAPTTLFPCAAAPSVIAMCCGGRDSVDSMRPSLWLWACLQAHMLFREVPQTDRWAEAPMASATKWSHAVLAVACGCLVLLLPVLAGGAPVEGMHFVTAPAAVMARAPGRAHLIRASKGPHGAGPDPEVAEVHSQASPTGPAFGPVPGATAASSTPGLGRMTLGLALAALAAVYGAIKRGAGPGPGARVPPRYAACALRGARAAPDRRLGPALRAAAADDAASAPEAGARAPRGLRAAKAFLEEKCEPQFADVPSVSASDLVEGPGAAGGGGSVLFVDVRSPEEQSVSTLPGAITAKDLFQSPGQARGRDVVCYSGTGGRSGRFVTEVLSWPDADRPWNSIRNLELGMVGWCHHSNRLRGPDGRRTTRVHAGSPAVAAMFPRGRGAPELEVVTAPPPGPTEWRRTVVLVGAGHAHVQVVAAHWAERRCGRRGPWRWMGPGRPAWGQRSARRPALGC